MRAHLFRCSECFREYRTAILSRDKEEPPQVALSPPHGRAALLRRLPVPAYAGALALLAVLLGGSLYLRERRQQENAPAIVNNPHGRETATAKNEAQNALGTEPSAAAVSPHPAPSVEARATAAPSPAIGADGEKPQRRQEEAQVPEQDRRDLVSAVNTISVDLEDYPALRAADDDAAARGPIRLAPARTRLNLRLPEGSVAGSYLVGVVNSSDELLATARAASRKGTNLSVTLNLRKLSPGKYRLRVTRDGETPGFYPVVIED
jgi:hypothetical protein